MAFQENDIQNKKSIKDKYNKQKYSEKKVLLKNKVKKNSDYFCVKEFQEV